MVPPMAALILTLGPSGPLDLIPVLGPVLVIKEILQTPTVPWSHIFITTCASTVLAWIVISWSARLLEQERFLFPGMIRAGWGRFRQWGPRPDAPGAMESLALFAACLGSFLAVSLVAGTLFGAEYPGQSLMAAQFFGLLAPVIIHHVLGDYQAKKNLFLKAPSSQAIAISLGLIPIAVLISMSLGIAQSPFIPENNQDAEMMDKILTQIIDSGGLIFLIVVAAVTPGI